MRLRDIAFNNLRRRRGRVLLVALGLLIGVATVVMLVSVTAAVDADVQDKLDRFGANIIVTPKSNDLALSYGGVSVASAAYDVQELRVEDLDKIRSIEAKANLATVAPKLVGTVESGGQRFTLVGVDFPSELKMKAWWRIDGRAPEKANEVLLGKKLADKLDLGPNHVLELGGQRFVVTGVLGDTGAAEDVLAFVHLGAAEAVLGRPGSLSFVEVSALCNACPIEEIIAQIQEKLPNAEVTALAQAVEGRRQTVEQLRSLAGAISLMVVIIGGLVVLTTTMAAVTERTREIGILRAIGFRRRHVASVFLLEATVVGLLGGLAGWLVGAGAVWALAPTVLRLENVPPPDPIVALGALALAVVVALVGSAYPAVKAANLDPVDSLRYI